MPIQFVHCHICPMKDLCSFSASEESYIYHHYDGCGEYPLNNRQISKLTEAMNNCPIKRVVREFL